jgi:hypothetical protein
VKRNYLRAALAAVVVLAVAAAVPFAVVRGPAGPSAATHILPAEGELAPALAKKLALAAKFSPQTSMQDLGEGDHTGAADQDWLEHSTPGLDIPSVALTQSRADWKKGKSRGDRGGADWTPLGPVNGISPHNQYRNRSVYTAGTTNFSGRIAHVAIDPSCDKNGDGKGKCRLWIANANGGVWMTDDALASTPDWKYVSMSFEHNSTASIALDPNDKHADTLWVGTGEPNACGSGCEAGVGLYKSTDGGKSWTGPYGKDDFNNRAVGSIAVKPGDSNTIFAASGRAVRGVSNVCCTGADALIPGAPHFGVYRSTDGGSSWQLVNQGADALCTAATPDTVSLNGTACSARGARRVKFDPVDPNTVYASFFGRGIWRSTDSGTTWAQIMAPVEPSQGNRNERDEFDVVELPDGATRMYVGAGGGGLAARFRRNDDVRTAPGAEVKAGWVTMTSGAIDTPGYSSYGYCDPQCSYDNYVYVPPGATADTVYLSGAHNYGENNFGPDPQGRSNGRAVLLSTDGGATFTDMTDDASDKLYPVELHPDHHALVTNPTNWKQFFDVGDGGISRSNGAFVDGSADCVDPKHYTGSALAFCQRVLSRIPERIANINEGLRTLHFYELNYNPRNPDVISAGSQDNGTWETVGSKENWLNVNVADGGHANYDIADPNFRQSSWQNGQLMVSYRLQDQADQNWIADTLTLPGAFGGYGNEAVAFTGPVTNDPSQAGWLWTAREHVFRSTNYGRNPILTQDTHRAHCNVWHSDGDVDGNGVYEPAKDICDDWKPLGDPGPAGKLTGTAYGFDRLGSYVAAVERTRADTHTVWAATGTGRIFVSKNADTLLPAAVVFRRIDNTLGTTNAPARYPTAIQIDPQDSNHAWIVYSGFNAKTPATPGHVFEVRFDPTTGLATFTQLDGSTFGDIPATSLAVSDRHSIYVGTDYGVVVSTVAGQWQPAGSGLPNMPVSDLVLVPERGLLYAATHGQGAWSLTVDAIESDDNRDWHGDKADKPGKAGKK